MLGERPAGTGDVHVVGRVDSDLVAHAADGEVIVRRDGYLNVAVWRPGTGTWFVVNADGTYFTKVWGTVGDIPLGGKSSGS